MADWALFTNHGLVLVYIAKNPDKTAREIGNNVGFTERTAHKIIVDLEKVGYITRAKVGRQNTYTIHPDMPIKDSVANATVGELLSTLGWKSKEMQKALEMLSPHDV